MLARSEYFPVHAMCVLFHTRLFLSLNRAVPYIYTRLYILLSYYDQLIIGVSTDVPDYPNLTTGVDYYRLLWQELNKKFGNASTQVFVMAVGQQLCPAEYAITYGNTKLAAQKTFELVDHTIACATTYSPKGSSISKMWERLLQEDGPKAGKEHKPAFEKARDALFANYEEDKHKKLYQDYLDKKIALKQKKDQIKTECLKSYGDQWESNFNEKLQNSKEYIEFESAAKVVQPYLNAIEVWEYGPLGHRLRQMRQGITMILKACMVYKCDQVPYTPDKLFHALALHGVTQLRIKKLPFMRYMNVYICSI